MTAQLPVFAHQYPGTLCYLSIRKLAFDECMFMLERFEFSPEIVHQLKDRMGQTLDAKLAAHTVTHKCFSHGNTCVCSCRGFCDKSLIHLLESMRTRLANGDVFASIIRYLNVHAGFIPRKLCYVRRHVLQRYWHRVDGYEDFCIGTGYLCSEATHEENLTLHYCRCEYCVLHNLKESRDKYNY